MSHKKLNAIFMGTPDFALPSLEILFNHPQINLKHVISMPDRKAGRGHQEKSPEVIAFAKNKKIPFFQTENINKEEEFLTNLKTQNIDIIIVLAFAQFLGKSILELPTLGCFNIHTSLLPKYRGAAPIQYALLNQDKKTGVSIQRMVKKMDAGNIVHEKEVPIAELETGGLLYTRLKFTAGLALNEFIDKLLSGRQLIEREQNEDDVSFAPTLKREDGYLNFKENSAHQLHARLKALHPWPGTYCFLGKKRLKVLDAVISTKNVSPGVVDRTFDKFIVGTKEGSLELTQVQLEGKKACTALELLRGIREEITLNPET